MSLEEKYVDDLYKIDPLLEIVKQNIEKQGMPSISVADGFGRLLTMLVKMSGSKKLLEVGALGGYSGICLARGLPNEGSLVSLELLEPYANVAKQHMEQAGLGHYVEYRIGDAKESFAKLEEEGKTFDFFFIDADKEGYPIYLEYAIKLAEPGAIIVGDNIFLRGRTLNNEKQGPSVQAVRAFNERIANDPRLESTVLPGYDGLALAIVRK